MSTMSRVPDWKADQKMDRARAFYEPMSIGYHPGWKCADRESKLDRKFVPKISDALAAKTLIEHPVRPQIKMENYKTLRQVEEEKKSREAEAVLSAHCLPTKFPVDAEKIRYPQSQKRGQDNPLYATAAQVIGSEVPAPHQLPERYFPKNCDYSKSYTDSRPRFTGLVTKPTLSRAHRDLDEYY